jgi:hypothetical protein
MGDQTQAVLQEVLGLSEQAVAELAARGVVRLARAPEKAVA